MHIFEQINKLAHCRTVYLGMALALAMQASIGYAADHVVPTLPTGGHLLSYKDAPPEIHLTPAQSEKVAQGEPVYTQVQSDGGESGRAAAVFRVHASPKVVWSVIASFNSYPQWIDSLKDTEIYKVEGERVFVRFKLKKWPLTINYHIEHNAPMERLGWMTWKLDYNKKNDLKDSVGFWRVAQVPNEPNKSDVSYSVELKLSVPCPGFIKDAIVKTGIVEATQWVKRQAEIRAKEQEKLTPQVLAPKPEINEIKPNESGNPQQIKQDQHEKKPLTSPSKTHT